MVRQAVSIETYQNTIFGHISDKIKKGEKFWQAASIGLSLQFPTLLILYFLWKCSNEAEGILLLFLILVTVLQVTRDVTQVS